MDRPSRNIVGVILLCASLATIIVGYKFVSFWASPASDGPSQFVFYEIKPHESPLTVAKELKSLGIVSSVRLFYWYGRLTGKNKKFRAGDYRFTTKMTPDEVMAIIMSGISYGVPLTVPEGYTFKQIAELVEAMRPGAGKKFEKLCSDKGVIERVGLTWHPDTLEGYLFPETYSVGRKETEEEIIHQMVKKYREVFTLEYVARAKELGMNEHEAVTLASIIEKETGAKQERPIISSVFHNRLKKKMRLQTDPTVIYGIKNFNGNLTRKDLETPTPYNTYTIKGLPPGPIANPGKEAITAALYPVESEYLFFVSHNDGTHEFTKTFDDHQKAVAKFQLDPKAREGKSWRDLNKKQQ